MHARQPVLGLFAKWPQSGLVKTRLADAVGAERAAQIARAFLLDTLRRLALVPVRRVVAFTPESHRAAFAGLLQDRYSLRPQGDADLGDRLKRFLAAEVE